ncbi:MAG: sigma-70 family RNA polymerase sigma factor [Acidimicrobiales bacterium]|jgi:RNA polymerase sigma factor (sigma-70 family)|nr:sigma-70 family RNA polymerase sigma factor [Acidimicrobiales bacterium]
MAHRSAFDADLGSARAFVSTIAHRRAVDRVRSEEASRRRERADAVKAPVVDVTAEPEAAAIESLERRLVRSALDRLTDTQREAIVMAYYDGRSYPEVAALLDVPLGTVKTRIRDGLIRLRDTNAADDSSTTTVDSGADDDMADDDMADDDMADTPDDVATIWSELVDAGLSDAQADCVTDAVVAEWGADALSQTGRIADEDLLRLRDIVFDCA